MKPRFAQRIAVLAISSVFPAFALATDNKPSMPSKDTPTSQPPAAVRTAPADRPTSAGDPATRPQTMPADTAPYSDRAHMGQWKSEKERLEDALKAGAGKDRAFFRQELARLGYRITSVNKDQPDEFEVEVVNGRNSYEVQVNFDKNSSVAKSVEVSSNLWKADATKKAMRDSSYQVDYPKAVSPEAAAYSDRARMKAWSNEKERLEKALKVGQSKDYYRAELAKLGYKVTAVNEDKADYAEYEIVRGHNSYEVQVDFDKATGRSTKVDVTTNLWEHETTDRALERKNVSRKEAKTKP